MHFRSERISAILQKTTDGNLQPNGTKISLSFGHVVSIAFRSVPSEKASIPTTRATAAVTNQTAQGKTDVKYDWLHVTCTEIRSVTTAVTVAVP
uniref:Uncharacterized protein n=1 Tax=Romanomermis culicivorax TaxID=13658 RepID=A0A915KYX4_ROMCU